MDSESEIMTEANYEEIEERIPKPGGGETVKKYLKGKLLGKGGFAKCYELRCLNNKKVFAVKIIDKASMTKSSTKSKLKSEIKIHKSMCHKNIVKFEHYFEDNDYVYILLEICKNKTLNELLKRRKIISELEVRYYLAQILSAVKYMHENRVIHRDLKLGNLFLGQNLVIKIGDFGLATKLEYDGERKHTVCGTPNYIAPEILENKHSGHSYEVDYWAIGVIVYTLLIGKPPFETEDVKETYKKITANNYIFPSNVFISDEAKDFIKEILVTDPNKRLTPDKMYQHPFMTITPLPKEMPQYTLANPPKMSFFRTYDINSEGKGGRSAEPITKATQLSFINNKENLEIMRDFALHTLKKCDMNIGYVDLRDTTKNLPPEKKLNRSQNKEQHQLLKNNNQIFQNNLKHLVYCDTLYDYSENFGLLYKMNKDNLIGAVFNDKSILFKYFGKSNVYYVNRKKGINTPKMYDKKNIVTEIKQKYEILTNFEKYLNTEKDKEKLNNNSINVNANNKKIYIKKIIKSDKAIMMKFSNKIIQLTFKDDTKLIIDNEETQQVYFFDKNNKKYHYSIHLVNKSTNKRFINRYEHYKKIFFEKMDERFQKIQQQKELENGGKENQEEENEEETGKEEQEQEQEQEQEEFPNHHHHHQQNELNKTT